MPDHLQNELVQRYLARSALFWKFSREARFVQWQKQARNASWKSLSWDCEALGISPEGKAASERLGFAATEVFAHPAVLQDLPELFDYYRLIGCISNKGLAQMRRGLGLAAAKPGADGDRTVRLCVLLNRFISNALARTASANRESLIRTMFAEAGSEWQGTWVNQIGQLAAQDLQRIITDYARVNSLVDDPKTEAAAEEGNCLVLKSGNSIRFGSEPDVECRSQKQELLCVLEIKGSADAAGAQTRLGETKKSFAKAKSENPRCVTIFLPSVLTKAVENQFKTEREIDKIFNLLGILRDDAKRAEFLAELFKFILREEV